MDIETRCPRPCHIVRETLHMLGLVLDVARSSLDLGCRVNRVLDCLVPERCRTSQCQCLKTSSSALWFGYVFNVNIKALTSSLRVSELDLMIPFGSPASLVSFSCCWLLYFSMFLPCYCQFRSSSSQFNQNIPSLCLCRLGMYIQDQRCKVVLD